MLAISLGTCFHTSAGAHPFETFFTKQDLNALKCVMVAYTPLNILVKYIWTRSRYQNA